MAYYRSTAAYQARGARHGRLSVELETGTGEWIVVRHLRYGFSVLWRGDKETAHLVAFAQAEKDKTVRAF